MKKICTGLLLPKIKTPIKTNRSMKLTCALLFAASFGVFATGNAQTMRGIFRWRMYPLGKSFQK